MSNNKEWKLVPVEPTEEMDKAAMHIAENDGYELDVHQIDRLWAGFQARASKNFGIPAI